MNTLKLKAFSMLTATALLLSCNDEDGFRPCLRGNGDLISETRALADFDKVDYQIEGEIEIRKGSIHEIRIEGNSNQVEHLKTRVSNGRLKIYSERCLKSSDFTFVVYTPELEEVKLSGSGDALVVDDFSSGEMTFDVSGSGKITASSESALKVKVKISGSGELNLEGACQTFDAQVSGSGKVHAYGLVCNTLNAGISGSGNIEAFVSNTLNANISGSGTIRYKGTAVINSNISGSGKVIKVQ